MNRRYAWYVAACCWRAQRWIAPGAVFLLAIAVTFVNGGSPMASFGEGAAWLFPVSAWLAVATLDGEPPGSSAIGVAAAGGPARARIAKVTVAAGVALVLATISVGLVVLDSRSVTWSQLGAGVLGHVICAAGGVALGTLCTRPVVSGTGWSLLAIAAAGVADLVVPAAPPVRATLDAFDAGGGRSMWLQLAGATVEAAALVAVLIVASSRAARARS